MKGTAEYGGYVFGVGENSSAAKAGVKKEGGITEYNSERIEGTAEFRREVRETPAGRVAQLSVWRAGRTQRLSAEIGQTPGPNRDTFFGRGQNPETRDFDSPGRRGFDSRQPPYFETPVPPS